ncbi:MAG: 4Fe-4S dicluster domain-containing protein [Anaerolineae bacterium]|nr:4Fe-4S dicluster domain-containing protein [Anaerolineae bacterium]
MITTQSQVCRDCQACALACSLYHDGQCHLGLARLRIIKDMARYTFDIRLCRHCDPPECLAACPTPAMRLDERGVVLIDDGQCTRCGLCASACPHEAIFYCEPEDRYVKCDLCAGREEGPLCVALCPVGALSAVDDMEGRV